MDCIVLIVLGKVKEGIEWFYLGKICVELDMVEIEVFEGKFILDLGFVGRIVCCYVDCVSCCVMIEECFLGVM